MLRSLLLLAPMVGAAVAATEPNSPACPGYRATNVREGHNSLTADLTLAGKPCNTYGTDLKNLKLLVEYQTDERLHVKIYDANEQVYQVPESVVPRVDGKGGSRKKSVLKFNFKANPFSFQVKRGREVLFDTSGSNLVFQDQYLNLRTSLPRDPNLYGLGEHTDPLRLTTTNYTRTLWNRDSYGIPENSNLYGSHPVYYDHRGEDGTHGVFLLNSNGMDIKIDKTKDGKQFLEYNALGGIFDFYFFNGDTPKDASIEYAKVAGLPAMQSYWSFGFHQCRYGYRDAFEVAEVVQNYTQAKIPLETMWTDIDYMDRRRVFTLDPDRFPLEKVRELVSYLHKHDQKYIVMVDPAVSVSDNKGFNDGMEQGVFMKHQNGSLYKGAVWPGVTAYPDWFHPDIQKYWDGQFNDFFSPEKGVDIDGLWIDMNEAANFCTYPCLDPEGYSIENNLPPAAPPVRPNPRPLPGFPDDFQPPAASKRSVAKGSKVGLPGRDLLNPRYQIRNDAGLISSKTINTDLIHAGEGYAEYDTHNLYGTMMSSASRQSMAQRRPAVRPLIITRSTFAGAGTHVGHWLGDNLADWKHYRISIAQMLSFASMFQVPMVGSDICGFGGDTNEELCARWARLGAFYPFFRNHNEITSIPQEFYRWESVAESARKAIEVRYKLLDYVYTAFHRQTQTGEPFLQPMFYMYPEDKNTFSNDMQFFYGDSILVSPVHDVSQTSVEAYFPKDIFYDWNTGDVLRGRGAKVTLSNISVTDIPIHIRGGSIVPIRSESAMTTVELRKKGFELLIAPGQDGTASGTLYLDDGDSLKQSASLELEFKYRKGNLQIKGKFGMHTDLKINAITLLGQTSVPRQVTLSRAGKADSKFDPARQSVTIKTDLSLNESSEIDIN
ncbi:putative alpha-glucosidase [Aspergillus clavatus NRRL 1]|uniref:Probable alpha/beta-glucosidase agdC n=1 Tax=Aspergillus clavatus (strain ATCC 1007 / CBS 513.65 / DSM 816 / NCTC 3887 / NRRL 1 / QM 1276 / 107) TaxID=344612 RepID=AGDC_ASPCL|nr:alpha-glucosidase, putative [Aspergillus clavatus NRRL 1]A1CNK4.1 RecName: Full=Probable alpha/beta-glucosidase agdC; Flags: Precursor [Aspergillus clavatus NRRL 1]EAW07225.1 alpha-glucosidase, putative [Aspergillus clavatus NRRL 1]